MRILGKLLFIAPALAVLGAVLLDAPGAGAQEREPVDLELSITNREAEHERDGTFVATVRNNSDVTARDIKVQFEVEDLSPNRLSIILQERNVSGQTDIRVNTGTVDYDTLEWTIPQIRPGVRAVTRLRIDWTKTNPGLSGTSQTNRALVRFQGAIVESTPREAPGQLGNNRARHYVTTYAGLHALIILFGVNVSYGVDADPGTDTFTVRVTNPGDSLGIWRTTSVNQYQLRLKVTSSPGLRYTATPSSGTSFNRARSIWNIGTLPGATEPGGTPRLDIQVTGRGSLDVPEEDQCLTVEIEHVIPDPIIAWFPVTACMAHKALITQGDFAVFNWHDCLTETDYPCGSQASLELAAVKRSHKQGVYVVGDVHRQHFRSDDFSQGTNNMILQPEDAVLQVPDNSQTRVTESGNTVWLTLDPFDLYLGHQRLQDAGGWTDLKVSGTVTAPGGGPAPGSLSLKSRSGRFTFFDAPDETKVSSRAYQLSELGTNYQFPVRIEFGTLGTYAVLLEIEGTKAGTEYTDSATYTFHVGPVAELEVRDAPAHSLAQPGQRAYTIVARNQGPDTAPAVRVTLTGVPRDAETVTSRGSYAPGDCGDDGLCEGVWTIGEMLDTASHLAWGRTEGEVLTIIPPGASGGPITATIENTRDYSVTIDGTTHTASYYDYLDHNDEAEIALRPAPSAGPPGRPDRPTVNQVPAMARFPSFALVQWPDMEYLNGFRVSHYEVQRSSSPWETMDDDVGGTVYLDMRGGSAGAAYRVRAVNEAGGHGPWSLASSQGPGAVGAPTGLTAAVGLGGDRIDLSWFAPSEESGLRYRIEHATDGAGPWRTLQNSYSGTTYSHPGLRPGTTHFYRVAAVLGGLTSPWAYVQATTGVPDIYVPGWPMNLRFTAVDRTAVTLAWDPPVDDGGSRIIGYEYRVDGPCASGSGICDIAAPTRVSGTSRRISLPNRAGTYQFQVRALNAAGAGDWSQPIEKEVDPQASGGRMILSPSRLTVREGGEATYRVRLSSNPTTPLWLSLHWEGDEDLADELRYQQSLTLLPTGYDISGLPATCNAFRSGYDWESKSYAWNVGIPIKVVAAEDEDTVNGRLTITHDLWTPSADCLGMTADEWSPDPVYDGMMMIGLTVTERDTGSNSPSGNAVGPTGNTGAQQGGPGARQSEAGDTQGSPGAAGQPTAVTLALDPATVSESVGEGGVLTFFVDWARGLADQLRQALGGPGQWLKARLADLVA